MFCHVVMQDLFGAIFWEIYRTVKRVRAKLGFNIFMNIDTSRAVRTCARAVTRFLAGTNCMDSGIWG